MKNQDKKLLSLPMAIALVIGNMIGSGIFLLPATMAPYGGVSALGWLVTATGAILLALAFAWLSRTLKGASGLYAYTKHAFGDFAGFLVAWSYWLSIWITTAALATATVSYLSALIPALAESRVLGAGTALALLWVLTAVNLHSVRAAGGVQLWTVVLKVAPLLVLMLMGLPHIEFDNFTPFNPTDKSLMQATSAAATLALWSMLGLESAAVAASKVAHPERNVARATLWGTALAAVFTALICTAAMGIVAPALLAKSNAPMADVASVIWGATAGTVIAAVGALSAFGCINGWILLQGTLPQAMAKDGLFLKSAARENAGGASPVALVIGSVLASLMIVVNHTETLIGLFTFLALLATIANLVPYLFCAMAGLRVMDAKGPVPLTRPRAAVLLAASVYAMWALYGAGHEAVFWGFLLLLSGLPVYVWLRRGERVATV
ncbi:MAG TPA: amino acid permease [Verrucomicrobiae bacterium]|nr:amino acid permease [Verrucomicrobiae bacterium]